MAAVVAAKIRKARKEEEEAKQHTLDFYQVPTLQRNLDLCFPRKAIARPLSQFFPIDMSVSDLYIPTFGPPIFLQQNGQTDQGNI